MNPKSRIIMILVAFATVWATNFLIHGFWLAGTYKAAASLRQPEAEMIARMPWTLLAQFLAAAAFTMIFAAWVAEKRCITCSVKYAISMGVFAGAGQLMMYVVQPLPGSLVAKWFVAAIVQAVVLGIAMHKIYKPAAIATGK